MSDDAMGVLVRELAAHTGLQLQDDDAPRVAAILREYLGYIEALDAVDLELGDGGPLGFDLSRWLVGGS